MQNLQVLKLTNIFLLVCAKESHRLVLVGLDTNSKGARVMSCHTPTCQKCEENFLVENTSSEQDEMTPCATCRVPQGVSACTLIPACDPWNRRKTLMFHQSETPKSDIVNPSQIPTRDSIAEPTGILCSTGPGDSFPNAS